MLAAAPDRTQTLELIRTLFELIQKNTAIPQALKTHLIEVIQQARVLSHDPSSVHGDIFPEAIRLALSMRGSAELADDLEKITSFDSINTDLATRVLSEMQQTSANTSAA